MSTPVRQRTQTRRVFTTVGIGVAALAAVCGAITSWAKGDDEAPTTPTRPPVVETVTPVPTESGAAPSTDTVHFANCDAARAAGAAPLHRGDPGYRSELDRDGDGVACS